MMTRTAEERELTERLNREAVNIHSDVMIEVEKATCGCDYGGTSWTTHEQADRLTRSLRVKPGGHLLEIGAGAGWPGLYIARRSGCDLTLTDLPLNGLGIAMRRAAKDELGSRCRAVLSSAAALPFDDNRFDAVSHSDVLCCLEAKQAVLEECRRVLRPDGRMVFAVISVAAGLPDADHERATAAGPIFVNAPASYPQMLRDSGWTIRHRTDLTGQFMATLQRRLREEKLRSRRLCELLGRDELDQRLDRLSTTMAAVGNGLLKRTLYTVTPARGRLN